MSIFNYDLNKEAMVYYVKGGIGKVKKLNIFNIKNVLDDIFEINDGVCLFKVNDDVDEAFFKNVSFYSGNFSNAINFNLNGKYICFDKCIFDGNLYVENGSVKFMKPIFSSCFCNIVGTDIKRFEVSKLEKVDCWLDAISFDISSDELVIDADNVYFTLKNSYIDKIKLSNVSAGSRICINSREVEINDSDIVDYGNFKLENLDKLNLNNTSINGNLLLCVNAKVIMGNNFSLSAENIYINGNNYDNSKNHGGLNIISDCELREMIERERFISVLKAISNVCDREIMMNLEEEEARYSPYIDKLQRRIDEAKEYSDSRVKCLEKKLNKKDVQSYFLDK